VLAPSAQAATGDIPEVVHKVEPSVVTIAHDQGTGSGVVWSKDGVVVTNDHVVRVQDQASRKGYRSDHGICGTTRTLRDRTCDLEYCIDNPQ
jgi:serine protease DegQ